jgi:hypothetical protein
MIAAPARRRVTPRRETAAAPRARWMVHGFCPLTGSWRQVVHAETATGALVKYCAEHDMNPAACHVRPF